MKKEWTQEEAWELVKAKHVALGRGDDTDLAIASRAVELHEADLRAKGGTLAAEEVEFCLEHALPSERSRLRQHLTAQGARVAALEAENERLGSTPTVLRCIKAEDALAAAIARVAVLEEQVAAKSDACFHNAKGGPCDDCAAHDTALTKGWDDGTEAMRAACLEEVLLVCQREGVNQGMRRIYKAAIEGATP